MQCIATQGNYDVTCSPCVFVPFKKGDIQEKKKKNIDNGIDLTLPSIYI